MRARRERVLLFRSGRHLQVALDAVERAWPGAEVTVVATTAGVAALDQAGVPESRRILYGLTPSFRPLVFALSPCYWRALASRPDHVAVLWNSPDGWGQSNVDQTARLVAPVGFTAILPSGELITHRWFTLVRWDVSRAVRSLAVEAAIGLLLYAPARLARLFRF